MRFPTVMGGVVPVVNLPDVFVATEIRAQWH
jgi:hypothetical protein